MSRSVVRVLQAPALSVVLLVTGAAVVVYGLLVLALATGVVDGRAHGQIAATIYFKVVVLKGLLPQLILTLALHPLVRRARVRWATAATRSEAVAPGRGARLLELLVVSALAYCAVGPFLLTADFGSWPALRMTSAGQQISTFVLMTGTTGLAAWLPQAWPGRRTTDAAPGAA